MKFKTILIIFLLLCNISLFSDHSKISPEENKFNLYQSYNYSDSAKVIDLGVQPLWIPANLIIEVIKRDKILKYNLAKKGMRINYHSYMKGADVNYFLLKGSIEAGIGGDMPAIIAAASMDVIIPLLMQHGFLSIVADDYYTIKQLKNKKIAYAPDSNAHFALLRALQSVGIDKSQVKLIAMDIDEMPEALANKEITAFAAWEPVPLYTVSSYEGSVIIHRSLSCGFLYFNKIFYLQNQDAVKYILAAVIRSVKWLQRDEKNIYTSIGWCLQSIENFSQGKLIINQEQFFDLAVNDILNKSDSIKIPDSYLMTDGLLYEEYQFLLKFKKLTAQKEWDEVKTSFNINLFDEILQNSHKYELYNNDFIIE